MIGELRAYRLAVQDDQLLAQHRSFCDRIGRDSG